MKFFELNRWRGWVLIAVCGVLLAGVSVAGAEVEHDRDVTVEKTENGRAFTVDTSHTHVESGKTWTRSDQVDVTKTDTGRAWTRDSTGTAPSGRTWESHTEGSSTRDGSGGGSWSSHTDGTVTGRNGKSGAYTVDRDGTWTRNDRGGRDFTHNIDRIGDNGKTRSTTRTGSTWKIGQGTRGYASDATHTHGNGRVANVSREGTKVRTGNVTVRTGTATGSDNRGNSWTSKGQQVTVRNGDGTRDVRSIRRVTTGDGDTGVVRRSGTWEKKADGKGWNFDGKTTRTGTAFKGKKRATKSR